MKRRTFILGAGATSVGGSALLGTGAFSRVESQRNVSIQVAEDPDAYLGLHPLDTPNSNNYVSLDGRGHLEVDVSEHDDFDGPDAEPGEGVNSDSQTWFDGMFDICNQGKEDACVSYTAPDDFGREDAELIFYYDGDTDGDPSTSGRVDIEEDDPLPIPVGECVTIGLRTETFDVDATDEDPLFDGEVTIVADVDGDCFSDEPEPEPECPDCGAPDPGSNDFDLTVEEVDDSAFPTVETTVRVETEAGGDGDLTESDFQLCEETVDGLGDGFCGQTIDDVTFAGEDEEESADVMIALDTSGSMEGEKLDNAKDGAKTLVDTLGPGVNVGLVQITDTAQIVEYEGQDMTLGTDQAVIKDAIDSLSADGLTDMSGGIDTSQDEIDANGNPDTPDFMVVLANGGADNDSDTRQAAREARNVSNLNDEGDGTTIISIAYGEDADEVLMEDISSPPKVDDETIDDDDENAFVGETDDISDVFEDIGQIISGTYDIEYETANFEADGNDRTVQVYVDDPDAGDAAETGSYTAPSS